MSVVAVSGPRTYGVAVGDAVSKYRLVTIDSSGDAAHAGATDDVAGVADNDVAAAAADRTRGDTVTVCGLNHNGTLRMTASAAISVGDQLEKAAAGKVATVSAGEAIGFVALVAATADLDIIEVAPFK